MPGKRGAHFRALEKLLTIVDAFRDKEEWLRAFYGDIWQVKEILFAEGQTAKAAKRLLREMRRVWEKKVHGSATATCPDKAGTRVLTKWLKQTTSHWEGLFHCYSDPRIPHTNNEGEQLILVCKNLERRMANNPNPAVRFMRNGATTMLFVGRSTLPGEAFVAGCTAEIQASAATLLRSRCRKMGVIQRTRRDFDGELQRVMDRVRKASRGPPGQPSMISRAEAGT